MVKIILMTSHYVLSENSHFMIIPYKHLYAQKHSHDVRIRSLRKLSFHTTIPLIIPYKHLYGQNILMSSDYVLPVNSHFMTQKTKSSDTFEQSIYDRRLSETSIYSFPNTTTSFIN